MEAYGEISIKIKKILGVVKPFPQGGVWRLTIPKDAVEAHDLEKRTKKKEFFSYVFLDTDKGLFLLPIEKVVNVMTLRDALKFLDLSDLTKEDLEMLLEKES